MRKIQTMKMMQGARHNAEGVGDVGKADEPMYTTADQKEHFRILLDKLIVLILITTVLQL